MREIEIQGERQQTIQLFEETRKYIEKSSLEEVSLSEHVNQEFIDMKDCCFFKLTSLTYDDAYPHREAFENVLSSIDNPSFNFIYILSGSPLGVDIYIGTARNYNSDYDTRIHAVNYARMIEASFKGNFQGSTLNKLSREDMQAEIFNPISKLKRTSLITGVPSINKNENGKDSDFQGIDRLINSMSGETWRLITICEPAPTIEVQHVKDKIYELYERLHKFSKQSMQFGGNQSKSISTTKSNSSSKSKSIGTNESKTNGSSSGGGLDSTNKSSSKGTNQNKTESESSSDTYGQTSTKGKSFSVTGEVINKKIQETLKYLDEELLERMKLGHGKGLFKVSTYAMAENLNNLERLKSSIFSVFQGDKSSFSPLTARMIDDKIEPTRVKMLGNFQNYTEISCINPEVPMIYGNPIEGCHIGLSTYMTAKEISLIAGLPMKEVLGLELKEGVEFGLNINKSNDKLDQMILGHIIHRGQKLDNNPVYLAKESLNKHLFIAGVTGSGKTTTCQKLLIESNIPFWVIEPAKTEYRELYEKKGMGDIVYFTIGNEKLAPFRFNPFEILEGENITSHVDMLKATFTTAFPMEASMPQILEESIYECYRRYGWDIDNDINYYSDNPWAENGLYFPMLSDLVQIMTEVVKTKKFGQELQANYIGSLVSRISNLTVGSKGQMLNCKLSINFNELLDKKVVLEMEDLKSPEDKALMMGFILSRMAETLKIRHKRDKSFKHITLVEEAHRLLSKIEYGDNGSKKVSVEMFTDLLAEVRKYGESLIIVDQIPNKLAVEVLKNTNTKIIHKLFAKDDKEAIGDTMMMDDKQKQYLSSLQTGEAIVFSDGWSKPVHIKVVAETDTSNNEVDDEVIKQIGIVQKDRFISSYCLWFNKDKITAAQYKEVMRLNPKFKEIKNKLKKNQLSQEEWDIFHEAIIEISNKTNIEKSAIWRQLIWTYGINSGFIRDNLLEIDVALADFHSIYDDYLSRGKIDVDVI